MMHDQYTNLAGSVGRYLVTKRGELAYKVPARPAPVKSVRPDIGVRVYE